MRILCGIVNRLQREWKTLPELRRLLSDAKYEQVEKLENVQFNSLAPYKASYLSLGNLKMILVCRNYQRQIINVLWILSLRLQL